MPDIARAKGTHSPPPKGETSALAGAVASSAAAMAATAGPAAQLRDHMRRSMPRRAVRKGYVASAMHCRASSWMSEGVEGAEEKNAAGHMPLVRPAISM